MLSRIKSSWWLKKTLGQRAEIIAGLDFARTNILLLYIRDGFMSNVTFCSMFVEVVAESRLVGK